MIERNRKKERKNIVKGKKRQWNKEWKLNMKKRENRKWKETKIVKKERKKKESRTITWVISETAAVYYSSTTSSPFWSINSSYFFSIFYNIKEVEKSKREQKMKSIKRARK
jgi:hypothetical protein